MPVEYSEDAGLGDVDYRRTPLLESPELEIEYALNRWFVDGNGDPQEMAAYGMQRIANILPSSLTFVARTTYGLVDNDTSTPKAQPGSTVDARYNPDSASDGSESTGKASRTYSVMKGVDVGEGTLTCERGESTWMVELTCPAEHARPYQIDQPNAETELVIHSTDAGDTGLEVTIEDEGAETSETLTLDGADATTPVSTTATFTDLDAIEIADADGDVIDGDAGHDYAGNIVIAINDGSAETPEEGEWLAVMWGSDEYGSTYGDPGIPALGAGSHAEDPTTAEGELPFYHPNNMSLERPVGQTFENVGGVQSVEFEFGNNVERTPSGGREQVQHHAMFEPEATVTASGETVTQAMQHEQAAGTGEDTRIIFNRADDEYLDLINAVVSETDLESSATENNTENEFTILPQKGEDGGRALEISTAGSGA
ncbi:hypothetical protein [Halalkalicoccus sp. NIPERK01]|uniref:hypothetical protein n=1 Tax=Halalkalicoccus sp. NIPERK01 TaxID=3053469 RepID=UPI00256F48D9|nr:hypothetical protein [Halalkalicoccus sp. NIPERK01]MDL5361350.1 hypothetical protein [Halalkalicoccus sp. NIPERK01]